MTLSAEEFIRRFLLHVLPRGFVHIRDYALDGQPRQPGARGIMRSLAAKKELDLLQFAARRMAHPGRTCGQRGATALGFQPWPHSPSRHAR